MEGQHDTAWLQCVNLGGKGSAAELWTLAPGCSLNRFSLTCVRKADLVLVLGSSLTVPTACELPEECLAARHCKPDTWSHREKLSWPKDGGQLVIVNLQPTPKDSMASLRIFASCDEVMVPWHCERHPFMPPRSSWKRRSCLKAPERGACVLLCVH